jgi:hypothetical protein
MRALIRGNFNLNPDELDFETLCQLHGEAVWLEYSRAERIAEIIAAMFGIKKQE